MSKEDNNRKLAEWLGFLKPDRDETEAALQDRCYELRHWTLHRHSGAPIENFSLYFWTAPDFYVSEAANAMLLEKMPNPKVMADRKKDGTLWLCKSDWRFWHNGAEHADRKTAIILAALALIEAQREKSEGSR